MPSTPWVRETLCLLAAGENPVMRKALVIVGQDAEVVMDIVGEDMEVEGGGTAAAALNAARGNQGVRLLSSYYTASS